MKAVYWTIALAALFGLFVGADWQTEVCVFNIFNGWEPYAWICCLWEMSNWAAFDFWRAVRYTIFFVVVAVSFEFGWWMRDKISSPV